MSLFCIVACNCGCLHEQTIRWQPPPQKSKSSALSRADDPVALGGERNPISALQLFSMLGLRVGDGVSMVISVPHGIRVKLLYLRPIVIALSDTTNNRESMVFRSCWSSTPDLTVYRPTFLPHSAEVTTIVVSSLVLSAVLVFRYACEVLLKNGVWKLALQEVCPWRWYSTIYGSDSLGLAIQFSHWNF